MSSPHQVLLQSNETSIFWHCLHLNSYRNRFIRKVKITVFWQFNFTDHFSSQFLEFERVLLYLFVALCLYPNYTLLSNTIGQLLFKIKEIPTENLYTTVYEKQKVYMYEVIWKTKGLHVWSYIRLTSEFLYIKDSCGQLDSFHRETCKKARYEQL